jgi:hypothetical protein
MGTGETHTSGFRFCSHSNTLVNLARLSTAGGRLGLRSQSPKPSRDAPAAATAAAATIVRARRAAPIATPSLARRGHGLGHRSRFARRCAGRKQLRVNLIHSKSERDWRASVPFAPSRAALSMLHSCKLHTPRFNSSPKVLAARRVRGTRYARAPSARSSAHAPKVQAVS